MNIAVGFACLVAVSVTAGATGLPEQQLAVGEQLDDYDDDLLERKGPGGCGTRMFCGIAGGRCQPKDDECDGELRTNKFYCKGGKNCGCCIPRGPPGCVFGFKSYEDGAIIEDVCMELQCMKGNWEYLGTMRHECGICTVYGDPHFITYDPHNIINPPTFPPYSGNPITQYESTGNLIGEYVISQQGLDPARSLFGVYADVTKCDTDQACISRAQYREPGIKVDLVLSEDYDSDYCQNAPTPDPQCVTKILVNGEERSIADGGSVSAFSGTDGTVLIFKDGPCTSKNCQIYVVGSKGITVSLKVEPNHSFGWDHLNILPIQSLRHDIYGLCDTFTGALTYNYTLQDGSLMTNWLGDPNLDDFIESWKVPVSGPQTGESFFDEGCSCHYVPFKFGCKIRDPAPDNHACYCWRTGLECDGKVVNCIHPEDTSCTQATASLASCLQAYGGNCDGY